MPRPFRRAGGLDRVGRSCRVGRVPWRDSWLRSRAYPSSALPGFLRGLRRFALRRAMPRERRGVLATELARSRVRAACQMDQLDQQDQLERSCWLHLWTLASAVILVESGGFFRGELVEGEGGPVAVVADVVADLVAVFDDASREGVYRRVGRVFSATGRCLPESATPGS